MPERLDPSAAATAPLVSDAGGPIVKIAVQVQASTLAQPARRAAYAALLTAFPAGVEIWVLADEASRADASTLLQGSGMAAEVRPVWVGRDRLNASTVWMRDAFLGAQDRYVIVHAGLAGDQARWLAEQDGTATQSVIVALEGGDCLVGEDFRFAGINGVLNTMTIECHPCDYATALAKVAAIDARRLVVVGYRVRDLSNRYRWLRHKLSKQLLHQVRQLAGRPIRSAASEGWSWHNVVSSDAQRGGYLDRLRQEWAHIDLVVAVTGLRDPLGQSILLVASTTMAPCVVDHPDALVQGDCLDALAIYLSEQGFAVMRNPAPYPRRYQVVLPYNNAIVQRGPNIVWLPQFADGGDYAALDHANAALWLSLGFAVVPVAGWGAFLGDRGSIRCATNAITRRPLLQ